MSWDDTIAQETDKHFPGTSFSIALINARILLSLNSQGLETTEEEQNIVGILSNARTTVLTSYELWRRGLLLQTGVLLRNVLESSALAVVLSRDSALHSQYRDGDLFSTKLLSRAVTMLGLPGQDLARLYGQFSEHFVHISPMYRRLATWHMDLRRDKLPSQVVLLDVKFTFYLLDLCTEFCLYDTISEAHYWQRTESGLNFQPTAETEASLALFMEQDIDEVQKVLRVSRV
jgi:hypothetical protein